MTPNSDPTISTPSPDTASSSNRPHNNNIAAAKSQSHQLNCERCRKRKSKCDRADGGCTTCKRANVPCVFIDRPRLPRGRNGGRRKQDGELKARLARLEDLVRTFAPSSIETPTALLKLDEAKSSSTENTTGGVHRAGFSSRQSSHTDHSIGSGTHRRSETAADMQKYLGSGFWQSLSREVEGIADVLYDSSDDEDAASPEAIVDAATSLRQPPQIDLFLTEPDSFLYNPALLASPDAESASALCDVFIYRFNAMTPILHGPSLKRYFSGQDHYLEHAADDLGVRALSFAVFYAAIMTLHPEECLAQFNVEKQSALRRYRFACEVSLAQADLHRTNELVVLQTFIIYLIALRVEDSSRKPWTLLGVAFRLAHALRLHHDEFSLAMRPFDREMRRRVWHVLRRVDIQSALDRGTYPCLPPRTLIPFPLNIDDSDFGPHTAGELHSTEGWTMMSHFLVCIDGLGSLAGFNFSAIGDEYLARLAQNVATSPATHTQDMLTETDSTENAEHTPGNSKWNQAWAEHAASKRLVHERYLKYAEPGNDLHWFSEMVSNVILCQKTLFNVRPMRKEAGYMQPVHDERVFELGIELLEAACEIFESPRARPWKWGIKVHWHGLGIVLARLCIAPHGTLADRAWQAATVAYTHYSRVVADTEKGMLWRPVAKLMTRARQARAEMQATSEPEPSAISKPVEYLASIDPVGTDQSYPSRAPYTASNEPSTNTTASLPADFDMLSFQDPTSMDFNTYSSQFSTTDNYDNSSMIDTNLASWDMFIDDMNADYIGNDDFSEVMVPPMFPIYRKELQPKPSNGTARAYPPYIGAGFV